MTPSTLTTSTMPPSTLIPVAPTSRADLLGTYAPAETRFVSGHGSWLIDDTGARWLDFTAGIGVNALGFDSPVVRGAIEEALDTGLVHTSNLFRTVPAEALATALVASAFPSKVFFCNSGAESGEAAIKFARRIVGSRANSPETKFEVVAFRNGFHGRLHGTLAITDRPAYQAPFRPLMPGGVIVDLADPEAVASAITPERTAAVFVEPVMGEGGVTPIATETLQHLRTLCDAAGALLVFDEVQCGLGRTGTLWAWQESGVVPDILVTAKPLAGGLPMGAVLVGDTHAAAIRPGDHATTFGGGPLVASVALAGLAAVAAPDFLGEVRRKGARLEAGLHALTRRSNSARCAHGRGLMWGLSLDRPASEVAAAAREHHVLLVGAGPDVVRFLPPLTVTDDEIDLVLDVLDRVL